MYEEIIENMKNGDEDALCKLYSVYAQSALRSAYLITNNLHSAQDAVEDTFIQCYNNINKLKNNGAFKVWFYKILTRNAIDSLNEKMKTTVVLFYFNEMSIKEIAKITGSFEGTVKTRLFNARKKLKRFLETDMEA